MFRRDFFKMLGATVASAVCMPRFVFMGPTYYKEQLALSPEDFVNHYVQPAFAKVLAGEEKNRAQAFKDLAAIADKELKAVNGIFEWPS